MRRLGAAALATVSVWAPATLMLWLAFLIADLRCDESCTADRPARDSGIWMAQLVGLAVPAWIAANVMVVALAAGSRRVAAAAYGLALLLGCGWLFGFVGLPTWSYEWSHPLLWLPLVVFTLGGAGALRLGWVKR